MSIRWNKVTWYSKLLALALFVALPFIGFMLGVKYQQLKTTIPKKFCVDTIMCIRGAHWSAEDCKCVAD